MKNLVKEIGKTYVQAVLVCLGIFLVAVFYGLMPHNNFGLLLTFIFGFLVYAGYVFLKEILGV